jgi:hypothetical protein
MVGVHPLARLVDKLKKLQNRVKITEIQRTWKLSSRSLRQFRGSSCFVVGSRFSVLRSWFLKTRGQAAQKAERTAAEQSSGSATGLAKKKTEEGGGCEDGIMGGRNSQLTFE